MATDLIPISPRRRSGRDWRALVKAYGKRSCTREAFCHRHGVAVSTLDWWRRKLGDEPKTKQLVRATRPAEFDFIDLGASPADRPSWDIELDLGAGMVLRLRRS